MDNDLLWIRKIITSCDNYSEDVDLAILKSEDQTETQVRRMIRSVEKELTSGFPEVYIEGITSKQTKFRKTAYDYNRIIDPDSPSAIQEKLILEINSFANPVPFENMPVNSMIAQFLNEGGNKESIKKYELESFEINVLVPHSTLNEKILSLIRLSFYDDSIERIKLKVRHFYDIYFLSESDYCNNYLETEEFKLDFKRMYDEDKTKFDDPEKWLQTDYLESPIFTSFDDIWEKVKSTYNTDFKRLVHGEFPSEKDVSDKFREIINLL
ncbi:MAG TPA: nucleotidyl transferase AbiEii/AbiGii toxin family protein [Bacteroidales bacterium]|nr:nucleotidyl transferase AbiEii/AbiGii toxin family protein [Bacteroidales bacterium]